MHMHGVYLCGVCVCVCGVCVCAVWVWFFFVVCVVLACVFEYLHFSYQMDGGRKKRLCQVDPPHSELS